jgi:hypothetical protein
MVYSVKRQPNSGYSYSKAAIIKNGKNTGDMSCTSLPFSLVTSAGIFKQSMGAGNRVGIGLWLSYRPARLHSLAELVPWNRLLGSLKV